MAQGDLYASPLGAVYSTYMERPWPSRRLGRLFWGGDSTRYYASMETIRKAPPGATILDCPCGAGVAFRAIPPGRPGRYLAADLSPSMLRRARKRAERRGLNGIEFAQADAVELPLEPGEVDLYVSYWGLHCYPDPAAALREAARVLKPGARFVGSTFVREGDGWRERRVLRSGNGGLGMLGDERQMRGWIEKAGLEIASGSRSGPMFFFEARRTDAPGVQRGSGDLANPS
ncbi:MAG TPA: methyltransferase domain-containing protein [Solirubrobacterales bacterium]|nr:methyltransferase domain-containing protein [Solirubrobacterales bacterium]